MQVYVLAPVAINGVAMRNQYPWCKSSMVSDKQNRKGSKKVSDKQIEEISDQYNKWH